MHWELGVGGVRRTSVCRLDRAASRIPQYCNPRPHADCSVLSWVLVRVADLAAAAVLCSAEQSSGRGRDRANLAHRKSKRTRTVCREHGKVPVAPCTKASTGIMARRGVVILSTRPVYTSTEEYHARVALSMSLSVQHLSLPATRVMAC